LHRPWFHSEGSHGRVAPFASERRPFEVDWPDLQSASSPAGPASIYNQERELPCRWRRSDPRTASSRRSADVSTNKVHSGEGDLDEGAEPQTANRPPKRWCASNKVHSGEGNLDEGAEPQTAAANRPLEPKCLQTKYTVGS